MKSRCVFAISFLFFSALTGRALDVLHLNNGQAVQCQIEAITDNIVTFTIEVRQRTGQMATSKHTLPIDRVKFVDFGPIPGETELLAKLDTATVEEIDPVWDKLYRNLHRPKSNTGKVGIALGYALLKKDSDYQWKRAIELFDQLHEEAWDLEIRNEARQGRLKTLIRMGKLDQAIDEARKLAAETEDPTMLIEARYIVARADFAKLQKLEAENPKWDEDDTIRPERNELYHNTLDQFLWPFLFHGTKTEQASRGLLAAGEVYQFAKQTKLANATYGDIVQLYPETEAATTAQEILIQSKTTPKQSPDESTDKK